MRRKFSDLQLACAVATSTSIREVCHLLGIVGAGANYRAVRRRIQELDLDTSHFKQRRVPDLIPDVSEATLRSAVAASKSYAATIRHLGLPWSKRLQVKLKEQIAEFGLDISHFTGQGWSKGQSFPPRPRIPIEEILKKDRPFTTSSLRKRLLLEGIKEHRCESCDRTQWHARPIPLELDHINGDSDDNRLENLRLLCPNCHALTDNYRGREHRPSGCLRGLS